MTAWVGRFPSHDARRSRVAQGLVIAAAISLSLHLLVVYGPRLVSPSAAHAWTAPALAVRMISMPRAEASPPVAERAAEPAPAPTSRATKLPEVPAPRREAASRLPPVAPERTAAPQPRATPARAAPAYHPAGALDPPPRPLQDIEPEYPPEAGYREGTVVLRLSISETGNVDQVEILSATPPGLFDEAARTAFAHARFSPGRLLGVAVKCQMTIEVSFTPVNRGGAVSGRTY